MGGGNVKLGEVAGIRIAVNWSWLVVFTLIVWTLADGVFPSQNPRLSGNTHLAMAVVAALLFFASILLHELGHAWEARREGLEVDGITLWLFGGVSQFKGGFPSAGAEFRIAIAGPLVSLILGVVFVLIAIAGLPSAVDGVAAWLGYINLALLVFNLIPALPLDGGRVLRAALWQSRGDLGWATRVGTDIGRVFGYLLIAVGIGVTYWAFHHLAHLSLNVGFWNLVPIMLLMGAGLPCVFVTLSTVSLRTVRREDMTAATGLYTLARSVGGNLGYALVATLLERFSVVHHVHLSAHISNLNNAYPGYYTALAARLLPQTGDPVAAQNQALALIDALVHRQAAMLAYNDIARFFGVMFLCTLPLLLLFPRRKSARPSSTSTRH